jgi:hypothetical protein
MACAREEEFPMPFRHYDVGASEHIARWRSVMSGSIRYWFRISLIGDAVFNPADAAGRGNGSHSH